MKQVFAAFLAILLCAASAAHARPWQSDSGEIYDIYMVRTVDDDGDVFGIFGIYYEVDEETTTLNELVDAADSLFEEALAQYVLERDLSVGVIRFSPPGEELDEGELPSVIADVRYESYDGGAHWERVNYLEVPVAESPMFPSTPTSTVTLSDGTAFEMEPITSIAPGGPGTEGLNVRLVLPYFVLEGPTASATLARVWDEIVAPIARTQDANTVAVSIYNESSDGRFHMRPAFGGIFSKEPGEIWPTYAEMNDAAQ